MLHQLPLELVYEILIHVPYSEFIVLYKVLPQSLVDNALLVKLKHHHTWQDESLLRLVSTNCIEFVAPSNVAHASSPMQPLTRRRHHAVSEGRNESSLPLFFKHMDLEHRLIWLAPNFTSTQYYFEIKSFYVSHGKLKIRAATQRHLHQPQEKVLGSLCDIRNWMVSSRSSSEDILPITIGDTAVILDAYCAFTLDKKMEMVVGKNVDRQMPPRPPLPWTYSDQLPIGKSALRLWPMVETANCGYFVIEQVAISIPELLDSLVA